MEYDVLESFVDSVYGYAIRHTFDRFEADELAQEILYTAVRELPKLRDETKLAPWFWGIAKNVTRSFRRSKGKQRAMYAYDMPESLSYEEEYAVEKEEIYDALRTSIAMLSSVYRDIIVLYYYDGLSVKSISEKLQIPEGTVRWRLSEARKKLKKEDEKVKETALRPIKMWINMYGTRNTKTEDNITYPYEYINDALSQNILYACYEQAKGVEDLAQYCGVPAYYIEDRLDNLLKREAIREVSKGKYQTDFVIFSDKYGIYCEENAEKSMLPIMDKMLDALDGIAKDAEKLVFYRAGKSENDLYCLYGVMAFAYAEGKYCDLPFPPMERKYDGDRWCYLGFMQSGNHKRTRISVQHSANLGSRGSCSHTVFNYISGFTDRDMMFTSYINACEDILLTGRTQDTEAAANAIRDGYIRKQEDGSFFVTVPFFTKQQKADFDAIADRYLAPLMPEYLQCLNGFLKEYKKLFPKHLADDADRLCQNLFLGMFAVIAAYGQKTDRIPTPSPGSYCDVMIQFK